MALVVVGVSHHTAPVELRERFAFTESTAAEALAAMRESGLLEEGVILSTCNRVEIYGVIRAEPAAGTPQLRQCLMRTAQGAPADASEIYTLIEPASVEHLFKVAAGLDSMVLGETEILGQLKRAYEWARQSGHTGAVLNRTFQRAFNVAKQIRTQTNIQRGSVSVGSVAVELAEKIFETLNERQVMVIGAGDTSEKTARALLSRGASSVIVSNRSLDRAAVLAAELGGRAVPFEAWGAEFEKVDIVISSTAAPHYILDRAKLEPVLKARKHRPLLLIDIAVPRDIEPEVNFLENVYLYNIDDLQSIADDYLKMRREEIHRCEGIIRQKASSLLGERSAAAFPPPSRPIFGHE